MRRNIGTPAKHVSTALATSIVQYEMIRFCVFAENCVP